MASGVCELGRSPVFQVTSITYPEPGSWKSLQWSVITPCPPTPKGGMHDTLVKNTLILSLTLSFLRLASHIRARIHSGQVPGSLANALSGSYLLVMPLR